jgi:CheY-like chemotaxis protein
LNILAVDDDDLVLTNTVEMLEDLGHQVQAVGSAQEALDCLERASFDLLITDHAMPQMTGAQLIEQVRKRYPRLAIILVSGYAELTPGQRIEVPRLAKPFSQAQLREAINERGPG